ncbi:MAG TPA: energy transducer TonB, partial [Candidatus Baltobacteraceae bacterium]|nr:energy transducer TonB [Candidatus Baltobacteraceae bacterium]
RTPAPLTTVVPATPSPSASPAGPCGGHADSEPALTSTPDVAPISEQARSAKVNGTAAIHVALDPQGRVLNTALAQSSGNPGLDASALAMANSATYAPKYVHCKAVAGEYTFTVQFVAW